ncbi:hypothetical protein P692DRAFT_20828878, partial [Suillus brevipes Sb2]
MDSDWDIIQKCLQFSPELRPSADEVLDFIMRRLPSSDSSSPFDDPPDDARGGFRGAPPHHDSDSEDDSLPPRPERELTDVIIESQTQRSSPSSLC